MSDQAGESTALAERLAQVRARIANAAAAAGREPAEVRLQAVSKGHSAAAVRTAIELGVDYFGESRVQELQEKQTALPQAGVQWSLIGHLQTNKAGRAIELIDDFQALDSLRLAEVLDRRLAALGRDLPVLIEVNSSGEASKAGLAPAEVSDFARELARFPRLHPRGLMTVAAPGGGAATEACFVQMAKLQAALQRDNVLDSNWSELSMGMSGDFELAIKHGATCLRLGAALFGPRPVAA